ncbi:ROK family protein [Arthrobacter sp. ov118]|uniref:ROK family protein n=1 Tax=Arthrobacter sp. ov118 TaxID=1761747 RepID=UPI0008E9C2AF|nr:ROK family protein [Arthrobacter sp. ov118]SFU11314.1 glucokinase [Arthrobacter sp. ov118]
MRASSRTDIVGVDIGGTKIAAGYIGGGGRLVQTGVEPTTPGDGAANVAAVHRLLAHPDLDGSPVVGVSMATTMDENGALRDPHNWFGWRGVDLAELLRTDRREFVVVADAEAGAVGEAMIGASSGDQRALYVTVGTGIAHCFVEAGRPLSGAHKSAYFSGYTTPARCSWDGCDAPYVERISSGTAIARDFLGEERGDTRLVFDAARTGDRHARQIIEHAAWHLGVLIADLMLIYDPDSVVIGGGLGTGADSYRQRVAEVARGHLTVEHTRGIPIRRAGLGGSSCWAGAILVAREQCTDRAISEDAHTLISTQGRLP